MSFVANIARSLQQYGNVQQMLYCLLMHNRHVDFLINKLVIFIEKFSPLPDLNLGPPEYQADALPIESSRLGSISSYVQTSFKSQPDNYNEIIKY